MDIMLDLETMSSEPTASIVAIGAIAFNPDGPVLTDKDLDSPLCFYRNVDLNSCLRHGLHISGTTVNWWLKQSQEAREALHDPEPISIDQALLHLNSFVQKVNAYCIWSHATFDVPILQNAYSRVLFMQPPWKYPNARDIRTLQGLAYPGQKVIFGVPQEYKHNALYDAFRQAILVQTCMEKLRQG